MKLSTRDKKILLIMAGVAFLLIGWLLVYNPYMEKAEEFSLSSEPLRERLSELLALSADREHYIEETERLNAAIEEYTEQFPADVKEEDGILLANDMENALGLEITGISLGTKEYIAALSGSGEEPLIEEPEQTLQEQGNEKTEEALDEIEGVDSDAEEERGEALEAAAAESGDAALYRRQNTISFTGSYNGVKQTVQYLSRLSGRTTIDSVSLAFDASTGGLTGSLTVNQYAMSGLGKAYEEPDAGSVPTGTPDIFGTIGSRETETEEETEE